EECAARGRCCPCELGGQNERETGEHGARDLVQRHGRTFEHSRTTTLAPSRRGCSSRAAAWARLDSSGTSEKNATKRSRPRTASSTQLCATLCTPGRIGVDVAPSRGTNVRGWFSGSTLTTRRKGFSLRYWAWSASPGRHFSPSRSAPASPAPTYTRKELPP